MMKAPQKLLRTEVQKNTHKIAVLGGGSWGTALVKLLSENKRRVYWYLRDEVNAKHILAHGNNPKYLPGAHLRKKRLRISNDLIEIAEKADILVLAIPAAFIHDELQKLNPFSPKKLLFLPLKVSSLRPFRSLVIISITIVEYLTNKLPSLLAPAMPKKWPWKNSPTSPLQL